MSIDLEAVRAKVEERLDPEWVAKYGDAQWAAALALIGERPPSTPPPVRAAADDRRERMLLEKLAVYQRDLGTRLLAMAEQAYEQALVTAGARVNGRARSRLGKGRQAMVASVVEQHEPLRAWLSAVGITELELLRGSFDAFAEKARAEFETYRERCRKLIERAGLDPARYLERMDIDSAVDVLTVGLEAMARARLLNGDAETIQAAARKRTRMLPPFRARPMPATFDIPGLPNPDTLARAAARLVRNARAVAEGAAVFRMPATPDEMPDIVVSTARSFVEDLALDIFVDIGEEPTGAISVRGPIETIEGRRVSGPRRQPRVLRWRWVHGFYGEPRTPFDPHADDLDGEIFTDREHDPRLKNELGWPEVEYFHPGDHDHCTCEWVLVD